ncbi:hypothetical protein PACTADRAFT_47557 [Pachysolen tannophilus NRRL Y-2460]|uniref:Phosphatidic acid phosphatase type 2/haloperoxidase domain-containing protein n=1 Tax=Pachysolen tannophilus NRRL Y-2460 TaxID=669874 RepID=A0A1E4U126_PACTA|nr:hypothetical protein PACTADRAFT_47557 [Pachysolen tannophilus NRRL Y-2460]
MFKNAGIVPNDIRPPIHVRLIMNLDDFLYNFASLHGWLTCILSIVSGYFIYDFWYTIGKTNTGSKLVTSNNVDDTDSGSLDSGSLEFDEEDHRLENFVEFDLSSSSSSTNNNEDFQKRLDDAQMYSGSGNSNERTIINPASNVTTAGSAVSGASIPDSGAGIPTAGSTSGRNAHSESPYDEFDYDDDLFKHTLINSRSTVHKDYAYLPLGCLYYEPPLLFALSWLVLNFDYLLRFPQTTFKDLLAWTSYVLGHILAPIFTSIWLYLFHTPGAVKWFGLTMGLQNIAAVITHMVFPNAPPWFIQLYGEDASANYDMLGYAAGLTRVDIALDTHLNSDGFHKSPVVFGAFPSTHSAMAVLVCYFLSYYSRWHIVKVLGIGYVVLQWWATIYLDHHWRFDLFAGMVYALIVFTLFKSRLIIAEKVFVNARLSNDFKNGSTAGMRIFKNTRLQRWFDPYSK